MECVDRFQAKLLKDSVFHLLLLKSRAIPSLELSLTASPPPELLRVFVNCSSRPGRNLNSAQTSPHHSRQFNALEKSKLYICSFTKKRVCSSVHIKHLFSVTNMTLRGCTEPNCIHAFLII